MQPLSRFGAGLDAQKLPALHQEVDPFVKQVDVRHGHPAPDVGPYTAYDDCHRDLVNQTLGQKALDCGASVNVFMPCPFIREPLCLRGT